MYKLKTMRSESGSYLGELSLNFWLGGELRFPAMSPSAESISSPPPSLSAFFLGLRLRTTLSARRVWEGESVCSAFLAYLSRNSRVERGVGGIGDCDDCDMALQLLTNYNPRNEQIRKTLMLNDGEKTKD